MKDRKQVTTNGRAVFYAAMWEDLKKAALEKGWALALHGSLASDMDIMAMPWIEEATTDVEMIESIKNCFSDCDKIKIEISKMPNNRKVFTLSIWGDFYLDINIIENKKSYKVSQNTKAVLEVLEKEIIFEFDNLTINEFALINEVKEGFIITRPSSGKMIKLITSNMPEALKKEIIELIKLYCNH